MTSRELIGPAEGYRRIATEEAFIPPELHKMYRDLIASGGVNDPGFNSLVGYYLRQHERARTQCQRAAAGSRQPSARRHGRDRHRPADHLAHLSGRPGLQDRRGGRDGAIWPTTSSPRRSAGIRAFAGLIAAIAPQDPAEAAKEMARGVTKLGLKGVSRQLAYPGRISRRAEVLADLRGLRSARRAALHPSRTRRRRR